MAREIECPSVVECAGQISCKLDLNSGLMPWAKGPSRSTVWSSSQGKALRRKDTVKERLDIFLEGYTYTLEQEFKRIFTLVLDTFALTTGFTRDIVSL